MPDGTARVAQAAEIVDYFRVYRSEPELTVPIPAIKDEQLPLTIGIAAIGGGALGSAYANNGWIYAVHLDGDLVAAGADLRCGGIARTHLQMAAVLAVYLADAAEQQPLAGQADRLSLWAHDREANDGDV
jgi:hypothetical protein